MKTLKYVGPGFVPGVPAQDHDCDDDELAEELVKRGAYEYAPEVARAVAPPVKKGDKNEEE